MKILNLYAGIGGNRKKWEGHQITAVEHNEEIAKIYKNLYPNDKLIVGDAHDYLLKHYQEFDFIWTSPPCQTHSVLNNFRKEERVQKYPDMRLYQEIIFLKHNFRGLWIVENVRPYYSPLIPPDMKLGRHLFWCNFFITFKFFRKKTDLTKIKILDLYNFHGIDKSTFPDDFSLRKDQILKNCVDYEIGEHVLRCAIEKKDKYCQEDIFSLSC